MPETSITCSPKATPAKLQWQTFSRARGVLYLLQTRESLHRTAIGIVYSPVTVVKLHSNGSEPIAGSKRLGSLRILAHRPLWEEYHHASHLRVICIAVSDIALPGSCLAIAVTCLQSAFEVAVARSNKMSISVSPTSAVPYR